MGGGEPRIFLLHHFDPATGYYYLGKIVKILKYVVSLFPPSLALFSLWFIRGL